MASFAIHDDSLRERYHGGGEELGNARLLLERYYPLLTEVFPIAGEIETIASYDEYLRDPAMAWDIVVLSNAADGRIVGGIHWQALRDLGTSWVDAVAWVEHVWLINDPAVRRYDRFRDLLSAVRNHMRRAHVDVGFMEFNDPEKMSPEDMARDAAGGLSTRGPLRPRGAAGPCGRGPRPAVAGGHGARCGGRAVDARPAAPVGARWPVRAGPSHRGRATRARALRPARDGPWTAGPHAVARLLRIRAQPRGHPHSGH